MRIEILILVIFLLCFFGFLRNNDKNKKQQQRFQGVVGQGGLVLKIKNGVMTVKKGSINSRDIVFIDDLLKMYKVKSGTIERISYRGPMKFKGAVPDQIRQQLRNILIK